MSNNPQQRSSSYNPPPQQPVVSSSTVPSSSQQQVLSSSGGSSQGGNTMGSLLGGGYSSQNPTNSTRPNPYPPQSSQSSGQTQKQIFGKKPHDVQVEQLSVKLGLPDVYYCEQHSKISEVSFSSSFAREGYVDKSFSKIDNQEISSHASYFSDLNFLSLIDRSEQALGRML